MSDNLRWLTSEMLDFMRAHTSQELCEMAQRSVELEKELAELKPGARKWWRKSIELLELKGKVCSMPALRNEVGDWVTTAEGKANLFANSFDHC